MLGKTLYKVITNNFQLSIGKIYLILKKCLEETPTGLIKLFRESLEEQALHGVLSSGDFWEYFSEIIETQAF